MYAHKGIPEVQPDQLEYTVVGKDNVSICVTILLECVYVLCVYGLRPRVLRLAIQPASPFVYVWYREIGGDLAGIVSIIQYSMQSQFLSHMCTFWISTYMFHIP